MWLKQLKAKQVKQALRAKIGFDYRTAIAFTVISFLIFLHSFGELQLLTSLAAFFLTFIASIALLAKIFVKLKLEKSVEPAFLAFAVFFFIATVFLAAIGLMPAGVLLSSWLAPFLFALIMVFASFTLSSFAFFRAMHRVAPRASLRLLWILFLASMLLTIFVTSLFACGPSGAFSQFPPSPFDAFQLSSQIFCRLRLPL